MRIVKAAPTRGNVKADLERVLDRILPMRMFDEPLLFPFEKELSETGWSPAFDLIENEKEYIVRLEVPGMHKENLDISLTGNLLTVTGKREFVQEKEEETYLWREREVGQFRRVIRLPAEITGEKVDATFENGLLTIVLPKHAPVVASKVTIK